jgi:CRISPR-associated protein Cmr3
MILKISLQPLGKFFFGGEAGFIEAGQDARRATYVLHSRCYPQQTSVLGLLRNQLLLQNDLLWDNSARVTDPAAAKVLIGEHSYKIGHTGAYGAIEKIGPVWLESADGSLCPPGPRDDVQIEKKKGDGSIEMIDMAFTRKHGKPLLEGYSEKSGLYDTVRHPDGGMIKLEEAFLSNEQVGISKAARPNGMPVDDKEDEQGYYYQTFLMPKRPRNDETTIRGFVFYAQLADEVGQKGIHYRWADKDEKLPKDVRPYGLHTGIVEFGGERSAFRMTVEKTSLSEFPDPGLSYKYTRIGKGMKARRLVCLSPAFVDIQKLRGESLLIVSQSLTFRFFQSKVGSTGNYQAVNRGKTNNGLGESKLYQFLDRGGVVYFDPEKEPDIVALFKREDFQNIGYNQYAIL